MSSTVRKMSVTGETGSYIFILTVSKMPNIYKVWDKMEFKLFGLMWVSYRPASIRARAVLSLDRVAGVSRTGIKQPPMHYCARFFFFLFSQSLLWLAEPLSDTTPAGSEPFGMFLLTMILVYIHCISYREQNRCKTFSDKIALIFTKIFSRARGRTPALSVSFLMKKHISKRLHGHDINANLSLCIVAAALELQKGYLEEMKKVSKQKGKHEKRPRKRQKLANFFRIFGLCCLI